MRGHRDLEKKARSRRGHGGRTVVLSQMIMRRTPSYGRSCGSKSRYAKYVFHLRTPCLLENSRYPWLDATRGPVLFLMIHHLSQGIFTMAGMAKVIHHMVNRDCDVFEAAVTHRTRCRASRARAHTTLKRTANPRPLHAGGSSLSSSRS